ncbi:hypothetical protein HDK77DRAFT_487356 [Phyllosticta capitalensis]
MEIIEWMTPEQFINFAFAAYSSLQQRLIVPPMTWRIYAPLCRNLPAPRLPHRVNCAADGGGTTTAGPSSSPPTTISSTTPASTSSNSPRATTTTPNNLLIFAAWPLPTELTLIVLRRLRPRDLVRFVLGHYRLLPYLLPAITPDTNAQLTKAWAQVEIARRLAAAQEAEAGESGALGASTSLFGGRRRRERGERERRKRAWSV